ncbi:hypothetical protein G647_06749 [Cladophialophora carrionii CBS 160.54]|uniref:Uncharacterized protein n=1 Tax=Cladophialophora carrionii CBS 160.54 TaxID=1279043 RepID=V9D8N9_9EURO|nr:uncharacterized protein G647_06749 [Cladophialophora carrionii CBS 160.54]ETI22673.1 hypothetical protein G647_06749 [Cladophialophora carrionii CBS 160.54]
MNWSTIIILSLFLRQGLAGYDSGYWTPSPTTTQWWTPTTTSYWSTWTPTSTYTTWYTQQNVIVTVTSYLPCPVTSTVVYWECCDQCQNNCYYPPTTYIPGGWVGTTTVTSYTTTTPGPQPLQTITSNGLVIVMVNSDAAAQTQTPSIVYQVSNQAAAPAQEGGWPSLWSMGVLLVATATIMILL